MALYSSPVFFAGLVFIESFREAGFRADAFGSNLLDLSSASCSTPCRSRLESTRRYWWQRSPICCRWQ